MIIGATPEGNKELVGLTDGVRENAQSWKGLLLDLKRRRLVIGSELAIADGALGFWQAIEEVWPKTRGQRCWVHKTANAAYHSFSGEVEARTPPRYATLPFHPSPTSANSSSGSESVLICYYSDGLEPRG